MKAARIAPGCMPICTAWKATVKMPTTGIGKPENRRQRDRCRPSGTRSRPNCWPNRRSFRQGVVDHLAADHGDQRLDILDLVCRHGEIVAVEHQEIRVLSRRQRTEIAFLEQE